LQELGAIMQGLSWHNFRHFVGAVSLRKRERNFAGSTQGDFNDEYIARMDALAGAVHDLRSPLTTLAVLVDELRRQPGADDCRKLEESLRIMSDQIEACRHILSALAAHGRDAPVDSRRIEPLEVSEESEQRGSGDDSAVSRKKLRFFGGRAERG